MLYNYIGPSSGLCQLINTPCGPNKWQTAMYEALLVLTKPKSVIMFDKLKQIKCNLKPVLQMLTNIFQ